TGAEVCQKRLVNLIHRLRDVHVAENELKDFLPLVNTELEHLSKEEIIKRFTFLEFNHLLDYYRDSPDLNRSDKMADGQRGERFVSGDRLFINLGKMDGLDAGKLLGMICDRCGVSREVIGRIDLKGAYSFFEVDKNHSQRIQDNLQGMEYKGRMVRVEMTEGKSDGSRDREKKPSGKRSFSKDKPTFRAKSGNQRGGKSKWR
ncbi:MAG: DbpA RNA binding domain-containing protein, partial [Flammeovirgaceae bacterium]|nr:DbpA RNA binding domain-containing protein [Flammeovirgaceae bacterium]